MFCPDCGANNPQGQKFCTRCGTNILAIDRAREIVGEMTSGDGAPYISPGGVLLIVALISVIGIIATTAGIVKLMEIDAGRGPIPVIFAISGFTSIVLISRYLLGLLQPGARKNRAPVYPAPPPALRGTTNRALQEPPPGFQSVVEEPTQQFEPEKRRP